ncbi:hypothetical protein NL676_034227 [Syzygium grande]|nr:hypothetical protein NL676_034227 [Syzygium grande]
MPKAHPAILMEKRQRQKLRQTKMPRSYRREPKAGWRLRSSRFEWSRAVRWGSGLWASSWGSSAFRVREMSVVTGRLRQANGNGKVEAWDSEVNGEEEEEQRRREEESPRRFAASARADRDDLLERGKSRKIKPIQREINGTGVWKVGARSAVGQP